MPDIKVEVDDDPVIVEVGLPPQVVIEIPNAQIDITEVLVQGPEGPPGDAEDAVVSQDIDFIVRLTQTEYDGLTPDESTLYIITD